MILRRQGEAFSCGSVGSRPGVVTAAAWITRFDPWPGNFCMPWPKFKTIFFLKKVGGKIALAVVEAASLLVFCNLP